MIQKLAVSGGLRTGKDNIADYCGYEKLGFADPMYQIGEHFFGKQSKDSMRSFYQFLGQYGWGRVDQDRFQLTPERAVFIDTIRRHGREMVSPEFRDVNWRKFGTTQTFWVEIFIDRVHKLLARQKDARIAVVNVRFEHELEPLKNAGFTHYHVMCSLPSLLDRLETLGKVTHKASVTYEYHYSSTDYIMHDEYSLRNNLALYEGWNETLVQEMFDTSEQLALRLNNTIADDRVIWNDHRPQPEGRNFLTRDQFAAIAKE
jgi:hypothetical protein